MKKETGARIIGENHRKKIRELASGNFSRNFAPGDKVVVISPDAKSAEFCSVVRLQENCVTVRKNPTGEPHEVAISDVLPAEMYATLLTRVLNEQGPN